MMINKKIIFLRVARAWLKSERLQAGKGLFHGLNFN